MPTTHHPSFAEPQAVETELTAVIDASSATIWMAAELIERTEIPVLDVMLALARLSRTGAIERVEPGYYRSRSAAPTSVC